MTSNDAAPPWTVDDLLDGDPLVHGHGPLQMVWMQLHAYLNADNLHIVRAFCAAVRRRPRTPAKLVALHLASEATDALADLIDELLVSDALLYAHYRGSELVENAIRARWTSLEIGERAAVIANVKYCERASPSYARTRSLIVAIPEVDRDQELKALLAELGGPPAGHSQPGGARSNEIAAERGLAAPPPRSLADQIADIPGWLTASPIPWNRIASAVYEDERAHAKDAKPHRVLSGETASLCVDAALTAVENFPGSSSSDNERTDILRVVDICLAHPQLADDDAANARLISALRTGVFQDQSPREVAIYALSFMRLWHWRQVRGHELTIEILKTATDPTVVDAAIHPLYRPDADAVVEGANVLIGSTRQANEKAAESLGRLMGEAALFLPAVAAELHRWLESPPATGVVETPEALKDYLSGVAFAMKSVAHHHQIDPRVYAAWATELWMLWRTPSLAKIEGKGALALYLASPLQKNDDAEGLATRYWTALCPLFQTILASSDSNEIYSALFELDIDQLLPIAIDELSRILQETVRMATSISGSRTSSEGRVAQVLLEIASHRHCPRETASEIHKTLLVVGARKEALDLERKWHENSGR